MSKYDDPRIEDFVGYCWEKHLAPKTINGYASDVLLFARFLEEKNEGPYPSLYDAPGKEIRRFLRKQEEEGLELTSIRRKHDSLKAFYRFLIFDEYRKDNPALGIDLRTVKKKPLVILTREEVRRLLNAPHGRNAIRDRAILHFYYSGPKRAEIETTYAADFDMGKQQLVVSGRVIRLAKSAAEAIESYHKIRPKTKETGALFLARGATPMQYKQVHVILWQYSHECGIEKKVTLEMLRSSYAVHALQDGFNVIDVLDTLGNKDLNAIQDEARMAYSERVGGGSEGLTQEVFDALDMRKVHESWQEVASLLDTKPSGALRATRELLEAVSKRILEAYPEGGAPENDTLGKMCKRALSVLLKAEDPENEYFNAFTRGVAGLVDRISDYRNLRGDAHASLDTRPVVRYEAEYAANLARATAAFMVQCYRIQKTTRAGRGPSEDRETNLTFTELERQALSRVLKNALKATPPQEQDALARMAGALTPRRRGGGEGVSKVSLPLTPTDARLLHSILPASPHEKSQHANAVKRIAQKLRRVADADSSQ